MQSVKTIITVCLFCLMVIGSDALFAQAPKEYLAPIATRIYGFETAGIDGMPILFSYGAIPSGIKLGKDTYSVGQQITSRGAIGYDFGTRLAYIDVIKIDQEQVNANVYFTVFFKISEKNNLPLF